MVANRASDLAGALREIVAEILMDLKRLSEHKNRDLIARAQVAQRFPRGGGNVLDPTLHASADIQQKNERKRLGIVTEVGDGLRLALVGDGEILLRKVRDDLAGFGDLYIYLNVCDAGAKNRSLGDFLCR